MHFFVQQPNGKGWTFFCKNSKKIARRLLSFTKIVALSGSLNIKSREWKYRRWNYTKEWNENNKWNEKHAKCDTILVNLWSHLESHIQHEAPRNCSPLLIDVQKWQLIVERWWMLISSAIPSFLEHENLAWKFWGFLMKFES